MKPARTAWSPFGTGRIQTKAKGGEKSLPWSEPAEPVSDAPL